MSKFVIPDNTNEIVARFKADFEANDSRLQDNLKSMFETKVPDPQSAARQMEAGAALPKHQIGAFRDRLAATLRIISSQ